MRNANDPNKTFYVKVKFIFTKTFKVTATKPDYALREAECMADEYLSNTDLNALEPQCESQIIE